MSTGMIPRGTIDVLRDYVDIILKAVGIDCTLYIPTTSSHKAAERLDVFATPADYSHASYSAKVFVNWNPSTYRLKKLGLFVEDQLPILVWFGNKATAISVPGVAAGTEVAIDTCVKSYFRLTPELIPENFQDVEEFELVNVASKGFQDAIIRKLYSAVPRRVQV
jgi:hypothetical protein